MSVSLISLSLTQIPTPTPTPIHCSLHHTRTHTAGTYSLTHEHTRAKLCTEQINICRVSRMAASLFFSLFFFNVSQLSRLNTGDPFAPFEWKARVGKLLGFRHGKATASASRPVVTNEPLLQPKFKLPRDRFSFGKYFKPRQPSPTRPFFSPCLIPMQGRSPYCACPRSLWTCVCGAVS